MHEPQQTRRPLDWAGKRYTDERDIIEGIPNKGETVVYVYGKPPLGDIDERKKNVYTHVLLAYRRGTQTNIA